MSAIFKFFKSIFKSISYPLSLLPVGSIKTKTLNPFIVIPDFDHSEATLKWTTSSKYSRDVVTGYSDFEGYKIYRSLDGGLTWGNSDDKIYDRFCEELKNENTLL